MQSKSEISSVCCWEPEALLPYMAKFIKSSKINIVLMIIFWFFGIVFVKASNKLVERIIK